MEIQQLRHFLAAIECGTISAAAEAENITQSGLSRSLKNLENSVGLPLVKRNPRGVEPTSFGKMLIAKARLIVNERDNAVDQLRAIRLAKAGVIKLGTTPNFALYFASDVLSKFSSSRPNVDFKIVSSSTKELIELLSVGELDFAIALLAQDFQMPEKIKAEPLFDSESVVFSSRGHSMTAAKEISIGSLAEESWAIIDSPAFITAFNTFFEEAGFAHPRVIMRTNSIALLLMCMKQKHMLTVLPRAIKNNPLAEHLTEIKSISPASKSQAAFIYRSEELLMTPAIKNLMHVFRQAANSLPQSSESGAT